MEFEKIKFTIAKIQFENLHLNADKTAIEANPSTHKIAEWVHNNFVPLGAVVKPANGGQWLDFENYVPIDIDKVKYERNKIYNIPNYGWQQIEQDLETINDISSPYTLRNYLFNHLPVCVINILDDSRLSV